MNYFPAIPSKLLLFGEHSILAGSSAITVPLWDFTAKLMVPVDEKDQNAIQSNLYIKEFVQYLSQDDIFKTHIDLNALREKVNEGLYLKSDIPPGYGLGSSASLCVAIYKAFGTSNLGQLGELKELYSRMESYFHGKSSGIDPVTIHTEKALVVKNSNIEFLNRTSTLFKDIHLYLLDSKISRNSVQMISVFRNMMEDEKYRIEFQQNYLPLLEKIINQISTVNTIHWENLVEFSGMQLEFFRKMIPDTIYNIWREKLLTGQTCFKILGAGGGGFFLVFSKEELCEMGEFTLTKVRIT